MWLVLAERHDAVADWACNGLAERGLRPIHLVTSDVLTAALRWECRLTTHGTWSEIALSSGLILRSHAIKGVLNRLDAPTYAHLSIGASVDRDYAVQEFTALLLSWLHSVPSIVLNRPSPRGLSGPWLRPSDWLPMAAQCGLETVPFRMTMENRDGPLPAPAGSDTRLLLVVANRLFGPPDVPTQVLEGSRRLAELAGSSLLGIDLVRLPSGGWLFAGASPHPDLRRGGLPVLDALADRLRGSDQ